MHNRYWVIGLVLGWLLLGGCATEPQPVEVTRLVSQELPVTVEVTRVVPQEVTRQVIVEQMVEVTRVITVAVTVEPTITETATMTETAVAQSTPPPAQAGNTYTVQAGDNLALIAVRTGASVASIQSANDLSDASLLTIGQVLLIPGWDGVLREVAIPTTAASTPQEPPAPATAVTQGSNLLPNPSFEGDWYFYLYNELQIPDGWQLITDEGPNTLEPGAGGLFLRPEVRVVPARDLPPAEQGLFIFDGSKTVKAFKGGAPTSFAMFTDITLPPGTYRMEIRFFSDTVAAYEGSQKVFALDPLAAEARIIFNNGGTAWQGTQSGQRNLITYDFTLNQTETVRVGAAFRNRFVMANNGWFLDNWSLYALSTP